MKKAYINPRISMQAVSSMMPLAGSQDVTSNNGITYGGVDEEGEKDPSVKQNHYNVWDDDWREQQQQQ